MPEEPEGLIPFVGYDLALAIIGAISGWSRFEYEIDELIWQLAGLEPECGACLTAQHQTVSARFDALLALSRVQNVSSEHIMQMNRLRSRSDALAKKRNRLVHDPWFVAYRTENQYRLQRTARARLEHSYVPVTLEEVKEIEVSIEKLIENFLTLRRDVLHAFWSPSA